MTGTAERLQLTGMRLREQRAEMRAGRADRRTERLNHRVDALQNELDREREAREELVDLVRHEALDGASRRGGTIALLAVGGVAYLLGAKAGRARYEQVASWIRGVRERGERAMGEPTSSSTS
ncbi:MAG TPA: hypothetical protein VE032_07375 [Actinomycetota bacterium]|nr:hypothetical protein [Actinomycetota bacterium]